MNFLFKTYLLFIFSSLFLNAVQLTDSFRIDGYGNISALSTTKNNEDKLQISGGFQGRFQVFEDISTTAQVYIEEGQDSNNLNDYETDIKWFYIDYYMGNDTTIRAGVFQFPVFKSSETGTIGYTNTWTNTPIEFYGAFGCDDFEGLELLKNFSYKDIDLLAQISYGESENTLYNKEGDSLTGDVDSLYAFTLKTSYDWIKLNIGYLQASAGMEFPAKPFENSPNKVTVDFNMYALESQFDIDNSSIKSGLIKSELSDDFANELKYYTSFEYKYKNITPYILYSSEIMDFKNQDKTPPDGNSPTIKKEIKKYSTGLRYDLNKNTALKFSYTHEINIRKNLDSTKGENSDESLMGTINVIF